MLYVGAGVYVLSWTQVSMLSIFAENITYKIKLNYYKACLNKDAAYYDEHNPTEMAAKISKETAGIRNGIGDKLGMCIMAFSSFILGFSFGFYWGW